MSFSQERQSANQLFPNPADGAVLDRRAPAFAWLPQPGAGPYEVVIQRDADGSEVLRQRCDRNLLLLRQGLEPGRYRWDIHALGCDAWRGVWRFTIAEDASEQTVPTAAALLAALPAERPRHLFTADRLAELRVRHARRLPALRRTIAQALADGLPPRPAFHRDPAATPYREYFGRHRDFIDRNLVACALGHALLNDSAAADLAKRCLLTICDWNPEGPCSVQGRWGDEVGLSHCRCLPAVFDCCYDLLDDNQRDLVARTIAQYGRQMAERLARIDFAANPGNSHAGRLPAYLGEAALVLHGTAAVDQATCTAWLDEALTIYGSIFPFYGGRDGGWAEGPFYASSYTKWYQPFFFAVEALSGYSFFDQHACYRHLAQFFLHCGQPAWECRPFGDGYWCQPEDPEWPGFCAQDPFGVYAERFGPQLARDLSAAIDPSVYRLHLLDIFRPPPPRPSGPPAAHSQSRLFSDAGYCSMHSDIANPEDDVALLTVAGRYGCGSHRHADQGNIAIIAGGRMLVGPSGYFGRQYGSDHHRNWTQQTRAHNCILVDGIGQDGSDVRCCGRILGLDDDGRTASTSIDLQACYPMLDRYQRQLRFDRQAMTITIDDLIEAPGSATISWLLHTLSPPRLAGDEIVVERGGHTARIRLQADGQDLPPPAISDRWGVDLNQGVPAAYRVERPRQYHLTWSTTTTGRCHLAAVITVTTDPG